MFISKERVKWHLKRTWWIILIGALVGIILFSFGIYSNYKDRGLEGKIQGQRTILLMADRNNNTYIDDFIAISTSSDFRKKLENNDALNISYTMEKTESGNGVIICLDATNKKEAFNFLEVIQKEATEVYLSYYPDVEIRTVDTVYGRTSSTSILQMKDIVALTLPLFLVCLCVYIMILYDKHLYSRKEVESIIQIPVYEFSIDECIEEVKSISSALSVCGRELEELTKSEIDCITISDFIKNKNLIYDQIILIIKRKIATIDELLDFLDMVRLQSINKEFKMQVFMVDNKDDRAKI